MSNKNKLNFSSLLSGFAMFDPKGFIATEQKQLIITAVLIMLIAVIPVFIMLFSFAWKYRATNKNSKYSPNWDHNKKLQIGWWLFLCLIIFALAIVLLKSTHALDPRKPIESENAPITIQAVALEWKWLFIYPDENIATVNYIQFPEDTPVIFEITADAPMNSLWIPQLGGQMYAMNGMKTELNIMANEIGTYDGRSSNISGDGFSGMKFDVHASSKNDFDTWVETTKKTNKMLNQWEYSKLAEPTKNHAQTTYLSVEEGLFDKIMAKYMPAEEMTHE